MTAEAITPVTDWAKIPARLQHQFFKHAEREAQLLKHLLERQQKQLNELRKELHFHEVRERNEWKDWRIASIDGSFSPNLSERLGGRYGVYAAGYMIFEGSELVEEGYRSDRLSRPQIRRPESTEILLGLYTTLLERQAALHCLRKKKVDYVLIDGTFFGFRVSARFLSRESIEPLVKKLREDSLALMNSRKCIAIVKRIRTQALDGWIKKSGRPIQMNDKAILAAVMPPSHWFSYAELLGADAAFNYYSDFANIKQSLREGGLELAVQEVQKRMRDTLFLRASESADTFLEIPRYFLRCNGANAPFCFETPPLFDIEPLLSYFQANHNPATGLPFPLDLIDANVSLPPGFTKEFVEEVEALLIKDPDLQNIDLANHFQPLNPQKED